MWHDTSIYLINWLFGYLQKPTRCIYNLHPIRGECWTCRKRVNNAKYNAFVIVYEKTPYKQTVSYLKSAFGFKHSIFVTVVKIYIS